MAKIGLLAPFEGIYRQEGYAALAAMRAALDEQSPAGVDVLPLALDTSRGVERAAQKLLADPSVVAVIGPYWVAEALSGGGIFAGDKWLYPFAPSNTERWAEEAIDAARAFAEQEKQALVLAGLPFGWPGTDVATVAGADGVQPGQAVLWLGDAAAGADFAQSLWARLPDIPIGLYAAGVETFRQRLGKPTASILFVVGWIDDGYSVWATSHSPNTPAAYAVYWLTADFLRRLAGETTTTDWQPAIFIVHNDGSLSLASDR